MNELLYQLYAGFRRGGPVMWPIAAISVMAWTVGFDRLWRLERFRRARKRFLVARAQPRGARRATGERAYDHLLDSISHPGALAFHHAFRRFLIVAEAELTAGFPAMKTWISAAPLLGLLGTVNGMIQTFAAITRFGIGNPHLMAEGISVALLTTQAGLLAAFPALLFHNYLLSRTRELLGAMMRDGERLAATGSSGGDRGSGGEHV
jgi:biopolymer transport protein ExbB